MLKGPFFRRRIVCMASLRGLGRVHLMLTYNPFKQKVLGFPKIIKMGAIFYSKVLKELFVNVL